MEGKESGGSIGSERIHIGFTDGGELVASRHDEGSEPEAAGHLGETATGAHVEAADQVRQIAEQFDSASRSIREASQDWDEKHMASAVDKLIAVRVAAEGNNDTELAQQATGVIGRIQKQRRISGDHLVAQGSTLHQAKGTALACFDTEVSQASFNNHKTNATRDIRAVKLGASSRSDTRRHMADLLQSFTNFELLNKLPLIAPDIQTLIDEARAGDNTVRENDFKLLNELLESVDGLQQNDSTLEIGGEDDAVADSGEIGAPPVDPQELAEMPVASTTSAEVGPAPTVDEPVAAAESSLPQGSAVLAGGQVAENLTVEEPRPSKTAVDATPLIEQNRENDQPEGKEGKEGESEEIKEKLSEVRVLLEEIANNGVGTQTERGWLESHYQLNNSLRAILEFAQQVKSYDTIDETERLMRELSATNDRATAYSQSIKALALSASSEINHRSLEASGGAALEVVIDGIDRMLRLEDAEIVQTYEQRAFLLGRISELALRLPDGIRVQVASKVEQMQVTNLANKESCVQALLPLRPVRSDLEGLEP